MDLLLGVKRERRGSGGGGIGVEWMGEGKWTYYVHAVDHAFDCVAFVFNDDAGDDQNELCC